jgi:hypothetical protein
VPKKPTREPSGVKIAHLLRKFLRDGYISGLDQNAIDVVVTNVKAPVLLDVEDVIRDLHPSALGEGGVVYASPVRLAVAVRGGRRFLIYICEEAHS